MEYVLLFTLGFCILYAVVRKKKMDHSFSKGDQVSAFGNVGTVKSISSNGMFVEVAFPDSECTVVFTIDGKVHSWNKKPSLRKL